MKTYITILFVTAFTAAHAQFFNRINNGVNTANGTISNLGNVANQISSFIPQKKQPDQPAPTEMPATNTANQALPDFITISNCDADLLAEMQQLISANAKITLTNIAYANDSATFSVTNAGPTFGLWQYINQSLPDKFKLVAMKDNALFIAKR